MIFLVKSLKKVKKMIKNIFTNSFGILFSRITGFVRDFLQASILGANIWSDMFIIAFKLPNLFRRIFGEGAFSQSFIPTFAKSTHKPIFTVLIFVKFVMVLVFLTLSVYVGGEYWTKLMAWGFSWEMISKATPLVIINFHYLILIFVVTFLASLLQYKNHFVVTAFSTVFLNISMITALLYSKGLPSSQIVYNLSYAVVIGGVLQLLVHLVMIKKLGLDKLFIVGLYRLKRKQNVIKDDIDRFKRGFLASILGGSTAQISAFMDGVLASFLVSGSISYLYYANRLFQFPLAIFAIATSTAIFPKVARHLNQNRDSEAKEMLNKSFWVLLYLLSFAVVVGVVFSKEIVWLLFERGAFSRVDTVMTGSVLVMYLVGLVPFGLAKIFSLWLYSTHKQAKAAKISAVSLGFNIILAIVLVYFFKVRGLALAGSLGGMMLFVLTVREYGLDEFIQIFNIKKVIIYTIFVSLSIVIMIALKGFLSVYLQL